MHADWSASMYKPEPYTAPTWAQHLPDIPHTRFKLAQLPTPVHKWHLPGVPDGFEVFIKRDDLTGCALSGNKVRKLEFILAEAVKNECKHVITCGSVTSNHCRATAVASAQVGLKCHLILKSSQNPNDLPCEGNMFFNKLCGANMYLIDQEYPDNAVWPPLIQISQNIRETSGEKSYMMPLGGSDTIGSFGYLEAYNELLSQGILDHVTDMVFASGSGGTLAGLAVANHLATNSKIGLHAIRISHGYSAKYLHDHCNSLFSSFGLDVKSEDIVNICDEYLGPGYYKTTEEDLDLIKKIGLTTGIILDPTYTAKATQGLLKEMQNNPHKFKGNKILFIHTGGMFGAIGHPSLLDSIKTNPSSKIVTLSEEMK